MRKSILLTLLCLFRFSFAVAQSQKQRIFYSDIDNFWVAYDSIRTTPDSLRQLRHLQKLYIDKGTRAFNA